MKIRIADIDTRVLNGKPGLRPGNNEPTMLTHSRAPELTLIHLIWDALENTIDGTKLGRIRMAVRIHG